MSSLCSVEGCGTPVLNKRGWCNKHYLRWRRHGIATAVPGACWIWDYSLNPTGYASITIKGHTARVNRLVCESVHGSPPTPKHQAAHNCGNRRCINPHHLEWKTRKENEADKLRHGTHQWGDKNPSAKLSNAQASEIRRGHASGVRAVELAAAYGIAVSTVYSITNGSRRNAPCLAKS